MNDWQDPFSFYQLMAWPALILFVASYQMHNPRKTILLWIPASLFMAVHFYGIGAIPALCIALGSTIRDSVSVYGPKKLLSYTIIAYVLYAWSATALSAHTALDYLPAIGTTFISMASLNRDCFWRHRMFAFGHQISWLTAFTFMGSYAGIAQILFVMQSNVIGIIRKVIKEKNPDPPSFKG